MQAASTAVATNTSWVAAATAARSSAAFAVVPRLALARAPNAATPTALPIDRANRLVAVTTPRSDQPTLDWAAISVGLAIRPMPRPTTKQQAATCQTADDSPSQTVASDPPMVSTAPIAAVLRKPRRR